MGTEDVSVTGAKSFRAEEGELSLTAEVGT